jgi:hypothetical protein
MDLEDEIHTCHNPFSKEPRRNRTVMQLGNREWMYSSSFPSDENGRAMQSGHKDKQHEQEDKRLI